LAHRFRHFVAEALGNRSPLYALLSGCIADDHALLGLVGENAPSGQPAPNMLFAAAQDALIRASPSDSESAVLRRYYPTLGGDRAPDDEAFDAFRAFVLGQRREIAALLGTRLVQTNEVRRCAYVAQACAFSARDAGCAKLALIEIGASIGLNLLWDRYHYRYFGTDGAHLGAVGALGSPVQIDTEWRGVLPDVKLPNVTSRTGLELRALSASNADDQRWLRALIWPEHTDRLALLDEALRIAADDPPTIVEGDAAARLADAFAALPQETCAVVYHTHVFNQLSDSQRNAVHRALNQAAHTRPIYRFGNDLLPCDGQAFPLIWQRWDRDAVVTRHLANVHGHGRWVEWLLP
jgi:hypothetical protein